MVMQVNNLNVGIFNVGGGAAPVVSTPEQRAASAQLHEMMSLSNRSMSDEELLAEIQRNAGEMDKNINMSLTNMRGGQLDLRALDAALNGIAAQQNALSSPPPSPLPALNLIAEVQVEDADGVRSMKSIGAILAAAGVNVGTVTMSPDSIRGLRDAIGAKVSSIKTNNERGQMEVQQMMSRRSQLFQMTSNVLASRSETRKSIVQNIR